MAKEEHRIHFSTSFCETSYDQFIVNLPHILDLEGKWKCAIKDIYISSKNIFIPLFVYVLGDFCETSILNNQEIPVLTKFYLEKSQQYSFFSHPLYIPIKQNQLNQIELAFVDENLKKIDFGDNFSIECTLHFYKHGW